MARRAFRGRGISQSQRRKKLWAPFAALPTTSGGAAIGTTPGNIVNFSLPTIPAGSAPGASASLGFVYDAAVDGIDPESTILRIRGSLFQDKNSVSSASGEFTTFAFGIGVLELGAAGLGAWPNPATPAGAEWDGWMFYRSINTSILDAEGTILDVKAMRKVQSGYSMIFVYGSQYTSSVNANLVADLDGAAQLTARGLFLLP